MGVAVADRWAEKVRETEYHKLLYATHKKCIDLPQLTYGLPRSNFKLQN